jgi:hypothetical protein
MPSGVTQQLRYGKINKMKTHSATYTDLQYGPISVNEHDTMRSGLGHYHNAHRVQKKNLML